MDNIENPSESVKCAVKNCEFSASKVEYYSDTGERRLCIEHYFSEKSDRFKIEARKLDDKLTRKQKEIESLTTEIDRLNQNILDTGIAHNLHLLLLQKYCSECEKTITPITTAEKKKLLTQIELLPNLELREDFYKTLQKFSKEKVKGGGKHA